MKIRDKLVGKWVDVAGPECPELTCYWPRADPGIFVQGRGYRSRPGKTEWICGTRAIHGCPMEPKLKDEK